MKILVDADACPKVIKNILFRAAVRTETLLTLVANHHFYVPPSPFIKTKKVGTGFDVADDVIVAMVEKNDLVITADIPLANQVIEKDALALNPRGTLYTKENIKQTLTMRNFMESVRETGLHTGGPNAMHSRDQQLFANQLDRILAKYKKKS